MISSAAKISLGGIFIGSRSTKFIVFILRASFASSVFDVEKSRTNASDVIAIFSPASPKFDLRVQGLVNEKEGV